MSGQNDRGAPRTIAPYTERFTQLWKRTDALLVALPDEALALKTIDLRLPFIFYVGHLPAFTLIQLYRVWPDEFKPINPDLDAIFERGIDPDVDDPTRCHDHSQIPSTWPSRSEVHRYRNAVRARVLDYCRQVDSSAGATPPDPALERAAAEYAGRDWGRAGGPVPVTDAGYRAYMRQQQRLLELVLEHEMMHQETLLYMLQYLPESVKAAALVPPVAAAVPLPPTAAAITSGMVVVPGARVTLGRSHVSGGFGWDNEFPSQEAVVRTLRVDRAPVTCAQFAEFVAASGFQTAGYWSTDDWAWVQREHVQAPATWQPCADSASGWAVRTVFGPPVPVQSGGAADWPVYVCHAMACAYLRWRAERDGQPGLRLPTEAELHRLVFPPEEQQRPGPGPGNYAWRHGGPTPVGTYAPNALGLLDALGNGWELSGTVFAGLPGFGPLLASYSGYSADFFDGKHFVVLGAGWGTDEALVRPSFRNWYQGRYPHPHVKFRAVLNDEEATTNTATPTSCS